MASNQLQHCGIKRLLGLLLCLACLLFSPAFAGGTTYIFNRMDNMLNDLSQNNQISKEDLQSWQDEMKILRQKVDERVQKNGGGLNATQDKDLFDELNFYNKNLYDLYQKSHNNAN